MGVADPRVLAYLPLDGGELTDLSANPFAPTPTASGADTSASSLAATEGRVGGAGQLRDGSAGFAWSQSKLNVPMSQFPTVSFWLRLDATTADGALLFSDSRRRIRVLKSESDYLLVVEIDDGAATRVAMLDRFIHPQTWVYVASGTTTFLFTGDAPDAEATLTLSVPAFGNSPRVAFGASATLPSVVGSFDEIKVWTGALSEAEACAAAGGTLLAAAHYCVFE